MFESRRLSILCVVLNAINICVTHSTSMKMDFIPSGDVRSDPIKNQNCLSDHVHTFYGKKFPLFRLISTLFSKRLL